MRVLKRFECLPEKMQNEAVYSYYASLKKKLPLLVLKRLFDIAASVALITLLLPLFCVVAISIKMDSKGKIIYKQYRVTQYGRQFKILKFRTMVENAETFGSLVTVGNDPRITKLGSVLRKYRIDEIPQLFNILVGDMSFVGTRPEVPKYVACYSDMMMSTLLLPAGLTSPASIFYKDEGMLLRGTEQVDETYITKILPAKMQYNLQYLESFNLWNDIKIMGRTILYVFAKYKSKMPEDRKADINV